MGGEDWAMWMDALMKNHLLADGAMTVAYSYIGPALTEPVYRKGTIGKAKDHLEATAFEITDSLKSISGKEISSPAISPKVSKLMGIIKLPNDFDYKTELTNALSKKHRK